MDSLRRFFAVFFTLLFCADGLLGQPGQPAAVASRVVREAQANAASAVSVVSGASYAPTVAPDSLASLFGTQLSRNVAYAQLDARGQLPTQLDGTSVQINGRPAGLIYVSPSQINLLIPPETEIGQATVSVSSSALGSSLSGTADVRLVAPAIFSTDSSGTGRGAILNAVTYRLDPFAVATPENSGADKRTRLAVFATGLRLAGNPTRDASKTNVAASVRVTATDASGKMWPLAVEYAGKAPGFFGLDQVNVVLPQEAEGIGPAGLQVIAESQPSNNVSVTIRAQAAPQITSFSPPSLPPGAQLTVMGKGFVASESVEVSPRNSVIIDAGDGKELALPLIGSTATSLTALVLPIAKDSQGTWYQGPVKVCVEVDGERSCSSQTLGIAAPIKSTQPAGSQLQSLQSQILDAAVGVQAQLSGSADAAVLKASGEASLAELKGMVDDALAGRPRSITFENIDGSSRTVTFDVKTIEQVESLLLANQSSANSAITELLYLGHRLSTLAANPACGPLSVEGQLQQLKQAHDTVVRSQKALAYISISVTVVAAVAACIAAGPGCIPAASLTMESFFAASATAFVLGSWVLFVPQLQIEYGQNNVQSLRVEEPALAVTPDQSKQFRVIGTFAPISGEVLKDKILTKAVTDVVFSLVPISKLKLPLVADLLARISNSLLKIAWNSWKNKNFPVQAGLPARDIDLGGSSLSIAPETAGESRATVTPACGGSGQTAATVIGRSSTSGQYASFYFVASSDKLLLLDQRNSPPQARLQVLVGQALTPSVTADKAAYKPGETVAWKGTGFPPNAGLSATRRDPSGNETTFSLVTDVQGSFSFTQQLSSSAASGSYTLTVKVVGASTTATGTLTVNPAAASLQVLTLSPSSVTAGASTTGTVALSGPAPTGGVVVTLQSSSTAAQVPAGGSVTVPAGQASATFTITTQAASAAQNVTITASYAGVSKTTTLTVSPAQGGSQPGTVRVNPQDGLNYVWIPPGTYTMGCSPGDSECYSDESPSHSVTIGKGFWMGQTEVTVGAYKRTGWTMPPGPYWDSGWGQDNLPMVNVTWDGARSYCTWAGGRLPTEAEWEYAARAGTQTKYHFGNDAGLLGDYAWYSGNSGNGAHPVGQKKPNAWGLFDMLGNVWEWCQDWYGTYPSQAVTDPQGPSSGSYRMQRGGLFMVLDASNARVSFRYGNHPGLYNGYYVGFRCVREVIPESAASVSLQAFTLSQSSVTAGATVTGTVTLSGAAPAGGGAVTLQSSSTAAQLPRSGSVTVPAGQTSATFTITAWPVSAAQNVTITASYGGVSKTATLAVNPAPPGVNPQDGLNYVWIPAGTYTMGCSPGDIECYGDEYPSHSVTISKGFWMGQTEVTVGAYKRFAQATGRTMPSGPFWDSTWKQDNLPMVKVTWDDTRSYCAWAGGRLPTEAEWEYAARAGTQTKYYFGNDAGLLGDYAWYYSNSGNVAHPVGQKKPNAWGLYDMLGNVWEWCQDWYGGYPSQAVTDPQGPSSGSSRILRGGSVALAWDTRVSSRDGDPGFSVSYNTGGFRCVREVIP